MNAATIVRPDWGDTACRWGAEQLRRKALKYFQDAGWDVADLYAADASKRQILAVGLGSDHLSILGHGNATVYTAQEEEYVFEVNDPDTLAFAQQSGNRSINALSCSIGKQLAPWMVENGLRAIKAYTEDFIFEINNSKFPNEVAEPYFLSHCTFDRAISVGANCGTAHDTELAEWENQIGKVNPWSSGYLIWDYQASKLFGDRAFIPIQNGTPPPSPPPDEPTGSETRGIYKSIAAKKAEHNWQAKEFKDIPKDTAIWGANFTISSFAKMHVQLLLFDGKPPDDMTEVIYEGSLNNLLAVVNCGDTGSANLERHLHGYKVRDKLYLGYWCHNMKMTKCDWHGQCSVRYEVEE